MGKSKTKSNYQKKFEAARTKLIYELTPIIMFALLVLLTIFLVSSLFIIGCAILSLIVFILLEFPYLKITYKDLRKAYTDYKSYQKRMSDYHENYYNF